MSSTKNFLIIEVTFLLLSAQGLEIKHKWLCFLIAEGQYETEKQQWVGEGVLNAFPN